MGCGSAPLDDLVLHRDEPDNFGIQVEPTGSLTNYMDMDIGGQCPQHFTHQETRDCSIQSHQG